MSDLCFQDGQTVLFIGDSITDCGRRDAAAPYGGGYVKFVIDLITAKYPERKINFINMGIGGNTVKDLHGRWQEDVIAHKPDWLSVKIGINDLHRHLRDSVEDLAPARYRELYDDILSQAAQKVDPKIVLIDPFYIRTPETADDFQQKVLDLIPQYIDIVQEMSEKYGTKIVHTHEMFQRQLQYRPA